MKRPWAAAWPRVFLLVVLSALLATSAEVLIWEYVGLERFPAEKAAVYRLACWAACLLLSTGLLWVVASRLQPAFTHPRRWLLLSLAGGGVLAGLLPEPRILPSADVRITATGRKNPAAHSTEVWLKEASDGRYPIRLSELVQKGDWDTSHGGLLATGSRPASLEWSGRCRESLQFGFASHRWCGIVAVQVNGDVREIDLYSQENHEQAVQVPVSSEGERIYRWGLQGAQWILLSLGLLTGAVLVGGSVATENAVSLPGPVENPLMLAEPSAGRRWAGLVGYPVLFAGLITLLLPLAAYPVTWDELWYMGLAFNPEQDPRVLNRYAHIYLISFFMRCVDDPYLGARLYWCAAAAGTLLSLAAATAPLRVPLRGLVMSLTALLLIGQDTFSWSMGIPYSDFTLMLITALSVALTLPPVLRREPLSGRRSFLLGALLLFALKSKETGVVLTALAVIPWIQPASGMLPTRRGFRNLLSYGVGLVAGVFVIALLDSILLGDFWFGLRPRNWELLFKFNHMPGRDTTTNYLSWMFRPENFTASLLYTLVLMPLVLLEANPRLVAILLIPAGYLLCLISHWSVNPIVSARYTVPFLPVMCLVGSYGAGRILEWSARESRWRSLVTGLAWTLVSLALVGLFFRTQLAPLAMKAGRGPQFLKDVVFAGTPVLCLALLALGWGFVPRLKTAACMAVLVLLVFTAVTPALRVVDANWWGSVRAKGLSRFSDIRLLARNADVSDRSRFLLAPDVYERQIYQRGPFFARTILSLGAGHRLRRDQVVVPARLDRLTPADLLSFDFILVQAGTEGPILAAMSAADPDARIEQRTARDHKPEITMLVNPAPRPPTALSTQPATEPFWPGMSLPDVRP